MSSFNKRKNMVLGLSILLFSFVLEGCNKVDVAIDRSDSENITICNGISSSFSVSVYDEVIISELKNARHGEKELYYGYGFVNNDSIQELFIIRGDSHADTVTIYSYDEIAGEPIYVGDFGGWGYCDYIPQGNSIISCYGNHGFFYIVDSGMDDDYHPYVKDVILRNAGNKIESFYGFSLGDFSGSMDRGDYDINRFDKPDERFLIDENEADLIEEKMRTGAIRISTEEICINKISN